jgi:hypothetical protein
MFANPTPQMTHTLLIFRWSSLSLLATALLLQMVPSTAQETKPTTPAPPPLADIAWVPVFEGISRTEFRLKQPRLIKAVALKIDLKAPGIAFLATPDNGPKPGETDGLKTSTFLQNHQLQAAINAAPFAPVVNDEGQPMDVSGLQISRGKVVSPAPKKSGLPALLLTQSNQARIASPPFGKLNDVWTAVSGFSVILKNGAVIEGNPSIHPRTAAGISADGRWLVWLVVDGRQFAYSGGATTMELGHWLKSLGCTEGINLDGGGTTTLAIAGKKGPEILNRPVHRGLPGCERPSGSHLGVTARPLAK